MCCTLRRRDFLSVAGLGAAAGAMAAPPVSHRDWAHDLWDPERPLVSPGRPVRIQPVLMYSLPKRREKTSWKSWGGIQTAEAVEQEAGRITGELRALAARADFPVEALPVRKVASVEEAARAAEAAADVAVIYPATGPGNMLRAYYGASNFVGSRIVALGGAQGKYAPEAVQVARDRFKLEIVEVGYADFEGRLRSALADRALMARAEQWTQTYLALPGTSLETDRHFVVNSFVLYGLFKDLMKEHNATAFTINSCMNTIIPMADTTACLTLSLLNDEGLLAFCESDFVIIPAGIFLRHLARKPVFLHNSTFPHGGVVTCAHCTGPRRMDGARYEPTRLLTHYESEFGAAPKVEMPKGQELTFIDPEYATCRWVGIRGVVEDNPFYEICRSQQDVRILGNWKDLLNEVRDSHWVMAYGNYLKEAAYAAPHIGVTWHAVSES